MKNDGVYYGNKPDALRSRDVKGKGKGNDNDDVLKSIGSFVGEASHHPDTGQKRTRTSSQDIQNLTEGQNHPDAITRTYELRIGALDTIMFEDWHKEQEVRNYNLNAILHDHDTSMQGISNAELQQGTSIYFHQEFINNEVQQELEQRATSHQAYKTATDAAKTNSAASVASENYRRRVFNQETAVIQQSINQVDKIVDAGIKQWHHAGGAIGGTPIADGGDQRYQPNEITQQAYDISMHELTDRLSKLQMMMLRLENERKTRSDIEQNILSFKRKEYSKGISMITKEQLRQHNFGQKFISMYQQQDIRVEKAAMYPQERAAVSKQTNLRLEQEFQRRKTFDDQFSREYNELLDIIHRDTFGQSRADMPQNKKRKFEQ
jgi:hypothetical protein